MKKIAILAIAAASLLGTSAFAQTSTVSSALSSQMSSAEPTASVEVNYGGVISALQAGKMADLTAITESTTINIVTVSSIKANGNTNALDNALKKNESAVATLRTSVGASAALSAKLTAAGYTADQVVAVVAEADGSVTVVVNDGN